MEVRALCRDDADAYRHARLRALAEDGWAFGADLATEETFDIDTWRSRVTPEDGLTLGAIDNAAIVGMCTVIPSGRGVMLGDVADIDGAWIVAMWIAHEYRSTGLADDVMSTAIHWSEEVGHRWLGLHVTEGNDRAVRVYERHGFVTLNEGYVRTSDGAFERRMRRMASPLV